MYNGAKRILAWIISHTHPIGFKSMNSPSNKGGDASL